MSQVARHYFRQGEVDRKCFIFPNRRAINFFGKYLSDLVAQEGQQAMMVPPMCTINDFFYRVSGFVPTGRVALLLELYKCYQKLYPGAEPLDDFIFWGDMLLADFNDVDKYLADPKALFTNVAEFKELGDDLSHLNDQQREAVMMFLGHFRNIGEASLKQGNVKLDFLRLWNILYDLYRDFNEDLARQGMSYEGMAYRSLAMQVKDRPVTDLLEGQFECDGFVFVGLNALNECEKRVLGKMQKAGIAEFCWDYCSDMIRNPHNKSSLFMSRNVAAFPPAFQLEYDRSFLPEFHVVSVPSAVGQVKYIPQILEKIAQERAEGRMDQVGKLTDEGTDCAIVLPDEGLLPYVLNTIPEEIEDINVTMGYPMTGSECYVLLMDLIQAQMQMLRKGGTLYFYHKPVRSLFFNSVLRNALQPEDMKVVAQIKEGLKYYIPLEDFKESPLISKIFRQVVTEVNNPDPEQIDRLAAYLLEVIGLVAPHLKQDGALVQELDYAMMCYTSITDLKGHQLAILPKTYKLLLSRILAGQDVHFKGEPLKGLQIMGPLETRALDFTNLVLLSCNEDMFPRKSIASSFIPAELRKGFGLPTYEYQDAVWAYYFYRMIQRSENVWLMVDSRASKMNTGEESRYIKQLEYHFGLQLDRTVIHSSHLSEGQGEVEGEEKPANIKEILQNTYLSASSIKDYLRCPAKFYYSKICKLSNDDEVVENVDARILGTVYHSTMQAIYLGEAAVDPSFSMEPEDIEAAVRSGRFVPMKEVTLDYVDKCRSKEFRPRIKAKIRAEIMKQLNTVEMRGRNLVIEDIIAKYVDETLRRDKNLMVQKQVNHFMVLGLEEKMLWDFEGFHFIGYIDRLDSFEPGTVRVIDYKTGKVEEKEMDVNEDNCDGIIESLFDLEAEDKMDIVVQIYLYDMFVRASDRFSSYSRVTNSIYSISEIFKSGILESPMCEKFNAGMTQKMKEMFEEMTDPAVPFKRTPVVKNCEWCDFKNICGR